MAKPFLPTKPWQWAIVPLLVLPLAAILLPVCAYSGPNPGSATASLAVRRLQAEGVWPETVRDRGGRFSGDLVRVEGGAAVYLVHGGCEGGCNRAEYRVAPSGRARRL